MDFVEYICDQQQNLRCRKYLEVLFCSLKEVSPTTAIQQQERDRYRDHIPVDFHKFLLNCVEKLKEAKPNEIDWKKLDDKYVCTLIIYVLDNEDFNVDCSLYLASIFFILNSLDIAGKVFFYAPIYLKILKVLKDSYAVNGDIVLMDHLKLFLTKFTLPEDTLNATISVLHSLTYCTNQVFRQITVDESGTSIGYKAFASLQVMVHNLSKYSNAKKLLFPVLLSLTSSLKTSLVDSTSRSVQVTHQANVRVFIKTNFEKFNCEEFCLVTDLLKFICFNSNYDEHEAIAKIIRHLPLNAYQNFVKFFCTAMTCDNLEFRKNSLNLVTLLLHDSFECQSETMRQIQMEIFLINVIRLLVDSNEEVRNKSLKIITQASEDTKCHDVLKRIINNTSGDVNKTSIFYVLNKIVDPKWNKKSTNVLYVQLICNIFILLEDLVITKNLNRLRHVCFQASPNDLKPCISYLKKLLTFYANKSNVVMYILSVFVKQIFNPMATSSVFAKELYNLVFSNLDVQEDSCMWSIPNYLVSNNFDVVGMFERFHSLHLLTENSVRLLLENKINENGCRTPALKLLCILLCFVKYDDHQILEEKIKRFVTGSLDYSSTDLSLTIYALNKMLEKKNVNDCNITQVNAFRNMRYTVSEAFYDQSFPGQCVKYVMMLILSYSRLIRDDNNWDVSTSQYFQESLEKKLTAVLERKLGHYSYFMRDVAYINELIVLRHLVLSSENFALLKNIVASVESELSDYLKENQQIWALCMSLYIKNCFVNENFVHECVTNLTMAITDANDFVKLQILYGLLDFCNVHLQYYDPLIPHLFSALYSKTPYVRFVASKILMKLVCDAQLRLMDGQYFLFMGLLADEKEIISRNMEVFINEKYAKHHHQTIAKYFVASIVHYNLYYDHPSINLSSNDQNFLKKRIYSINDRFSIYFRLFRFLPENSKFNVISQISAEIFGRMVNNTLLESPIVLQILEDSLTITLLVVPLDKFADIKDDREFYETEIRHLESDLLISDFKSLEINVSPEQSAILKRLLSNLFNLLYGTFGLEAKICQNLFFTIIVLTKTFYVIVKKLINEDSSHLKAFYKGLSSFYRKIPQQFEYCLLSVNPSTVAVDIDKQDMEFYVEDFDKFCLLPAQIFLGIDET